MKKKTTITVLIIVILGFIFFLFGKKLDPRGVPQNLNQEEKKDWLAEKLYESMYTRKPIDIGYEEPSQEDIQSKKQKTDLTKKYPSKINALFELGTNTATLFYFSDELKDLGVNTYFVQAETRIENGELKIFQPCYSKKCILSQEEAERVVIDRMLMAKQEGFSVGFVPDLPDAFEVGRENYNIDELNPRFKEMILKWAEIAEEYGVEYFVPINEYETLLYTNGYTIEKVYQYTNNFYDDLIPKIRKIYNGKIIIKSGALDSWSNQKGISRKKADLFGLGNWHAGTADEIKESTQKMVEVADEISVRDNLPWLVTEYYVATQEDVEESFGQEGIVLPMKEAYEAGLSELKKSEENIGFTFTGYIGRGKIRGTEAVSVLKNYFNK
ncbi:MAG: hypothetical protein U5L76_01245 [Patescibacteria group bacterium]|nr:hypothetical protein [Patescibacteria group bacterium]